MLISTAERLPDYTSTFNSEKFSKMRKEGNYLLQMRENLKISYILRDDESKSLPSIVNRLRKFFSWFLEAAWRFLQA